MCHHNLPWQSVFEFKLYRKLHYQLKIILCIVYFKISYQYFSIFHPFKIRTSRLIFL